MKISVAQIQYAISENRLETYLDSLSNAQFRVAGLQLVECIMPKLSDEAYWSMVKRLTQYNNRAFVGSILKNLSKLPEKRYIKDWAEVMTPTDKHKVVCALLPMAKLPAEVRYLLEILSPVDKHIDYLLQIPTMPTLFVLLSYMRDCEHDVPRLTTICRMLMKSNTSLTFNAVSLFKVFFDLKDVHATFSLRIEPYELSRIDSDFEVFASRLKYS